MPPWLPRRRRWITATTGSAVSDGPAIIRTPQYDKFFSVSIFDMKHNVPAGIVKDDGYMSVTIYGSDNKLLIPNDMKRYDQTTYSAEPNADGTYTITISPDGGGKNAIPSAGTDFYGILRAYVPVPGADMTVKVETR